MRTNRILVITVALALLVVVIVGEAALAVVYWTVRRAVHHGTLDAFFTWRDHQ